MKLLFMKYKMVKVNVTCVVDIDMIQPYKFNDKTVIGVKHWIDLDKYDYTREIEHNIGILYEDNFYEVFVDEDFDIIAQFYELKIFGEIDCTIYVGKLKFPAN